MMQIENCRVNHLKTPVGYRIDSPVFSWKVRDAKGKKQKCARVRISHEKDMKDCIFDTGYKNDLSSLAFSPEITLKPRTGYYWNVEVISDLEEHAVSETQYFETGKREEAWIGKWISCDSENERHPIFYKEISVPGEVKKARLYICGLGLYEARINGCKVGDEMFVPGCNAYDAWVQYQTWDITENLAKGSGNTIEVLLGNGWYKGRFGCDTTRVKGYYGQEWKLLAEIHILYEDGTEEILGTDETWKAKRSNLTFSNIYDGEHRDDTLVAEEENCFITEAPKGTLTERMSPAVRIHEKLKPVELIVTDAGEQVFDMGQNFAGIFKLRVKEEKGKKIHIQFGEVLQNGNFYRDNLRSAKAEYIYISNGEEVTLVPHFTFYGYRYVKIEGVSNLKIEDFTGLAVYSELGSTGSLTTGNELVNQLISNTRWGLKSNFVDVPTDCPQRDERLGWTGDAQVFSPTACYLEDSYAFYAKYLYDMAQEQKALDGKVPQVIPSFQYKDTSSVWGDAACIIPWNLYHFYGDIKILKDQFESMRSWVDYITSVDEGSNHTAWGNVFHYGDWLALDNRFGGIEEAEGGTDADYIAYVYYMVSAEIVAEAADILGYQCKAVKYGDLATEIRSHIKNTYFSKNGHCCVPTQTGLILALKYHLTSDEQWTQERLRKLFNKNLDKLETGFVGTPLLCPTLSENGMTDLAYHLLLNEGYPGWLYAVKLGATTIWERWNSVLEDGSISGTGMNSLNHYSYGSIVEWLFAYSAGIRQEKCNVGFTCTKISPELNWELKTVDAIYDSPAGEYRCKWEILDANHVKINVTIPFNCEAELTLPCTNDNPKRILEAGEYEFVYETSKSLKRIYSCNDTVGDLFSNQAVKETLQQIIPQASIVPTIYYERTLRSILMEYQGTLGIPPADVLEVMLGQLDATLAQI